MKKAITLETLAIMVQKGFNGIEERMATKAELDGVKKEVNSIRKEMDERFNKVDDDIRYIHGSLDVIQREISEIKKQLERVVYREELEAVKARITRLEKKLGI